MDAIEQIIDLAEQVDPAMAQQLRDQQERDEAHRIERLESFSNSLKRTRNKAIAWRAGTGVEEEWDRADDAYEGVDGANRGHMRVARKPSSTDGGVISSASMRSQRSSILLNITRTYVDAAASRVGDMLLPVDDRPWGLDPTPLPDELPQAAIQSSTPQQQGVENLGSAPTDPGQMSPEGSQMPPGMGGQKEPVDPARMAADGAAKQIEDWLVECRWHGEMRKVFDDAARLGTGVLKGPSPVRRVGRKVVNGPGGVQMVEDVRIAPESRHVKLRDFFPDPSCGNDVRNGSFVWERAMLSAKQLRDLKGLPGCIDEQIDRVLEQGPGSAKSGAREECRDDSLFEAWYFTGRAEREDLEAARVDLSGYPDGDVGLPCVATLVEDVVIQAAMSPFDSGDLPYDLMPWQRREGLPWGIGVAAQMETPQRGLTAALRNLMDNAGVSGGAQVVLSRNAVTPVDGRWEIGGGIKFWYLSDGAEVNEVRKAFEVFTIPSMQAELMNIIQFFMKAAEDSTGMPQLMQGQVNPSTPDTFSGQVLAMNNAGALLRRIARLSDDMVTERHIQRYYEWLLMYGEDDSIKGDFRVNARGSTAMVELALQTQFIYQMGQMVNNPAFGIDPEKWFSEMLKSQRLDPERFLMDDAKKAQMAQQVQPPPQIAVAQINAQARQQVAQMDAQVRQAIAQMQGQVSTQNTQAQVQASVEKMRMDTDRDAIYTETQHQRDISNAQAKLAELDVRRQLALLEYANREKISLDKVKADLAKKAMEIQSVERLVGLKAKAEDLPKPPVEPPGRARPGGSYVE